MDLNKWQIVGIFAVFLIIVGIFVFVPVQLQVILFFAGFIITVLYLVYVLFFEKGKYALMDVLDKAYMDLYQSTQIGSVPVPTPVLVKKHRNSSVESYVGDIVGRTLIPMDEEVMKKNKELKKWADNVGNNIWCMRIRTRKEHTLEKEILVLVNESQIDPDSLDMTGDIQFGTTIMLIGHFLKASRFYIVYDSQQTLSTEIGSIETMCLYESYIEGLKRYILSTDLGVRSKPHVLEKREMSKQQIEVAKK